jgi:hypothetical protein
MGTEGGDRSGGKILITRSGYYVEVILQLDTLLATAANDLEQSLIICLAAVLATIYTTQATRLLE